MVSLVERIDLHIVLTEDKSQDHSEDPDDPDHEFDLVSSSLLYRVGIYGRQALLKPAGRTEISTPYPSEKHGQYKHRYKYDKTSVDNVLRCSVNNKIGRKVPDRDRKEQKGDDNNCFSYLLSHLCALPFRSFFALAHHLR